MPQVGALPSENACFLPRTEMRETLAQPFSTGGVSVYRLGLLGRFAARKVFD